MIPTHLKQALANNQPFVLYRKPNETLVNAWFQKNDFLHTTKDLNTSCFVFAPFFGEEIVVFYPKDCVLLQEEIIPNVTLSEKEMILEKPTVDKEFHIQLVQKGIDAILDGKMQKVVLSRKEEVLIDEKSYELYYQRFLQKYPTAFVYWWYHPKIGMWMGATPEQLVQAENNNVKTVALAGTMVDQGRDLQEVVWGQKEQEEQKVVTDFIINRLQPLSSSIHQTKPFTHKAGSLLHIKTDIAAELKPEHSVQEVINALHPTPALCGFPKEEARDFIIENEGYNREFYGGYLGEWEIDNLHYAKTTDLFVNLRCMKIQNNQAYLFLGGGVNKDSDPVSEYYETVNKSKTVKSIL